MKNFSKILITSAVCASFMLSAAACSGKTESTTTTTSGTTTEASTSETTTTASESSSESSKDTEGPAGNGADNTDASSASSAPAKITVEYADEDTIDKEKCTFISLDKEGVITSIIFSTDVEVKDFKILSLEFTDADENGKPQYNYNSAYSQPSLVPGNDLVADLLFAGDIPNYGFSYIDTDGTLKLFALGLSGEDGSIVVTEI